MFFWISCFAAGVSLCSAVWVFTRPVAVGTPHLEPRPSGLLLRLAWRAAHPPPPLPATVPRWKRQAAAVTHRLLYLCLLVAPVSGFLGSSFSPYPIRFFGTPLPRWIAPWEAGKEAMSALHLAAVLLLAALVLLHVAGAFSHAIRRDGVFSRMAWPKPPSPRQPP